MILVNSILHSNIDSLTTTFSDLSDDLFEHFHNPLQILHSLNIWNCLFEFEKIQKAFQVDLKVVEYTATDVADTIVEFRLKLDS